VIERNVQPEFDFDDMPKPSATVIETPRVMTTIAPQPLSAPIVETTAASETVADVAPVTTSPIVEVAPAQSQTDEISAMPPSPAPVEIRVENPLVAAVIETALASESVAQTIEETPTPAPATSTPAPRPAVSSGSLFFALDAGTPASVIRHLITEPQPQKTEADEAETEEENEETPIASDASTGDTNDGNSGKNTERNVT
jgi:hypothetical protein